LELIFKHRIYLRSFILFYEIWKPFYQYKRIQTSAYLKINTEIVLPCHKEENCKVIIKGGGKNSNFFKLSFKYIHKIAVGHDFKLMSKKI